MKPYSKIRMIQVQSPTAEMRGNQLGSVERAVAPAYDYLSYLKSVVERKKEQASVTPYVSRRPMGAQSTYEAIAPRAAEMTEAWVWAAPLLPCCED